MNPGRSPSASTDTKPATRTGAIETQSPTRVGSDFLPGEHERTYVRFHKVHGKPHSVFSCIGTRKRFVLVLVVLLVLDPETRTPDQGQGRERRRGRKGGSWKASGSFIAPVLPLDQPIPGVAIGFNRDVEVFRGGLADPAVN